MTTAFVERRVKDAFNEFDKPQRSKLLRVRELIFETASNTAGVGSITETLKWGQPSYLTNETKSGTTIRLGISKGAKSQCAVFVHCQTDLIPSFRELYRSEFEFEGNRALILPAKGALPHKPLTHCLALALTYHLRKRQAG